MQYGLIGEKLEHSFSKLIHEDLAEYVYDLIPLAKDKVADFLAKREFAALNVTIPYKETVIPFLDEIDEKAKKIGAVNTIVNRNGRLLGYNTDYLGFRYLLEYNAVVPFGKKVLILGKGGAAKAVKAVLEDMGAAEILIVYYKDTPDTITYEECYAKHTDAQIIVNTTPVGMYPRFLESPLDLAAFSVLEAVVDVIYNPLRTQLVRDAQKKECVGIGGLEMLVGQAKYAVEIFLGKELSECIIAEETKRLYEKQSNLVLIGMSGCGKSSLGQELADVMKKEFVDTDAEIVKEIGMPIADFFAKYGEDAFREKETEVIAKLAGRNGLVVATGGGAVLHAQNMEMLKLNGNVIWIKRDVDLLESGNGRPLAPNGQAVQALYKKRLPIYQEAAEAIAENNGTWEEGVQAVIAAYHQCF